MPPQLPDTARTPDGCRSVIPAMTPHPLPQDKSLPLHPFFYNEEPKRWLPEVFAAQHGGDTRKFVEGVRFMSECRYFPLRTSMHVLLQYLECDRGKKQLDLLRSLSSFEVVSDHLAVDAVMVSTSLLRDNLRLTAKVSVGNARQVVRTKDEVEG